MEDNRMKKMRKCMAAFVGMAAAAALLAMICLAAPISLIDCLTPFPEATTIERPCNKVFIS